MALADLPVLFEVASATGLRFDHLRGDGEVLPLQVEGWMAEPRRGNGTTTAQLNDPVSTVSG